MSTGPGQDGWQDAGTDAPDEPHSLVDPPVEGDDAADPEEYRPGFPRADRDGRADEADVVEQDTEVPDEDDESEGA